MDLPITDPILQFTILVLAVLLVELTLERVQLPGILGLLLLGVVLGPGLTNILAREPMPDFLGHVGLVYLMFMAGLEIDLDTARERMRATLTLGALAFGFTFAATFAAGLWLGYEIPAALLLGALISSHTLLAYPILERLGLLRRAAVVTTIGGTLLTDTLALVLLAVTLSASGDGGPLEWAMPLLILAGLVLVTLRVLPALGRRLFDSQAFTQAERALFALVALLLLSTATELIGTEYVLGAFLAGVALNQPLGERPELREHIEFVGRMLFIPFFFVYTGMLFEVERMGSRDVLLLSGLLLGLLVAGKAAAAWVTGHLFDYSARERLLITGLTLPQAAATLAVAITASEAGILDRVVVDAAVLVIFVTCLAGPLLTSFVGRRLSDDDSDPHHCSSDPGVSGRSP